MTRLAVFLYLLLVALLVSAPRVLATHSITCEGSLSQGSADNVTVPAGAVCRLSGYTIDGSVTVLRDGYFEAGDTTIRGSVNAESALTVFLRDRTTVSGGVTAVSTPQVFVYGASVVRTLSVSNSESYGYGHVQICDASLGKLEITRTGPDILVGDPLARCPGNRVQGEALIADNATDSELTVWGNDVAGALLVTDNAGAAAKVVRNNRARGLYRADGNTPPFQESANS